MQHFSISTFYPQIDFDGCWSSDSSASFKKKTGVGSEKRKHSLTLFMKYTFTYECPLKSLFPCANNRLRGGDWKSKNIALNHTMFVFSHLIATISLAVLSHLTLHVFKCRYVCFSATSLCSGGRPCSVCTRLWKRPLYQFITWRKNTLRTKKRRPKQNV